MLRPGRGQGARKKIHELVRRASRSLSLPPRHPPRTCLQRQCLGPSQQQHHPCQHRWPKDPSLQVGEVVRQPSALLNDEMPAQIQPLQELGRVELVALAPAAPAAPVEALPVPLSPLRPRHTARSHHRSAPSFDQLRPQLCSRPAIVQALFRPPHVRRLGQATRPEAGSVAPAEVPRSGSQSRPGATWPLPDPPPRCSWARSCRY
mmetsp:Transcript_66677/g.145386  ORF Transcript_66677/g.145386 Transcript_66677/m.145386 type:complete len:205 (+) Transcript_66677:2374-2988(+)